MFKKIKGYIKMKYEMWLIGQVEKRNLSDIFNPGLYKKLDDLEYEKYMLELELHDREQEYDRLVYELLDVKERLERYED